MRRANWSSGGEPCQRSSGVDLDLKIPGLKTFTPSAADIARQAQSGQLPSSHVGIRQLGTAQGGMVDSGASKTLAALAFVGLVILDCILVMMIGGFIEKMQLRRELSPEVGNA